MNVFLIFNILRREECFYRNVKCIRLLRSIWFVGYFVYFCDVNVIKECIWINSMCIFWNVLSGSFNR